jgi:tape measure domain-containing protein
MASLGDIVIGLKMDAAPFGAGARNARGSLDGIASSAKSAAGQLVGLLGAGTAIGTLGWGVKLAADAEQSQIAFEVLLGSASMAKRMLAELKAFSDTSPFDQIVPREAAQTLLNFGLAHDKILPSIRMLGDVASGDAQKLKQLALVYGQMTAAGRLMGQDLLQFINAGFNPLQQISVRTGESIAELKKRMEAGGISALEVAQAFKDATSEGGRFFGMTDRQSRSLTGIWSTFKDQISSTLMTIGAQIIETLDLKRVLESTSKWLQFGSELAKTYGSQLTLVATVIGGPLIAAMLAYSAVQSVLIVKAITLRAISGPAAWAALAVGLATAVMITRSLADGMSDVEQEAKAAAKAVKDVKPNGGKPTEEGTSLSKIAEIQNRLKQLMDASKMSPDVAAAVAEREAAGILGALGINKTAAAADAAAERVNALYSALRQLNAVQELIPGSSQKIATAIRAEIDSASGLTKALEKQREEIQKLEDEANPKAARNRLFAAGATQEGLAKFDANEDQKKILGTFAKQRDELQKLQREMNPNSDREDLIAAGATTQELARFDVLKRQTDELRRQKKEAEDLAEAQKHAQEEMQSRADRLKESTLTAAEKQAKELKEIQELFLQGFIDEQTANRASAQVRSKGAKSPDQARAAIAGSSEAAQTVLRGAFGSKTLESLAQRANQLAERHLALAQAEANKTPQVLSIKMEEF